MVDAHAARDESLGSGEPRGGDERGVAEVAGGDESGAHIPSSTTLCAGPGAESRPVVRPIGKSWSDHAADGECDGHGG